MIDAKAILDSPEFLILVPAAMDRRQYYEDYKMDAARYRLFVARVPGTPPRLVATMPGQKVAFVTQILVISMLFSLSLFFASGSIGSNRTERYRQTLIALTGALLTMLFWFPMWFSYLEVRTVLLDNVPQASKVLTGFLFLIGFSALSVAWFHKVGDRVQGVVLIGSTCGAAVVAFLLPKSLSGMLTEKMLYLGLCVLSVSAIGTYVTYCSHIERETQIKEESSIIVEP